MKLENLRLTAPTCTSHLFALFSITFSSVLRVPEWETHTCVLWKYLLYIEFHLAASLCKYKAGTRKKGRVKERLFPQWRLFFFLYPPRLSVQALSVFLSSVICIKKSVIIGWGFFLFPLEAERYRTDSWSFWSPVCSSGLPPLQTFLWSKHYERTYHFKRRPFSAPFRRTCQSLWQRCNHQIYALLPCLPSQVTEGMRVWWRFLFC